MALDCDVVLPITWQEGEPLGFHRWKIGDLLDDGPYGTKQPPASNDKCTPDVILAPMLAFDATQSSFIQSLVRGVRNDVLVLPVRNEPRRNNDSSDTVIGGCCASRIIRRVFGSIDDFSSPSLLTLPQEDPA